MEETYPSEAEQYQALAIMNKFYKMPKKAPKPSSSYAHWRVADWYPTQDFLYFKLEFGQHKAESVIQADYFSWEWHAERTLYQKINRATKEINGSTEEEFKKSRVLED